MKEYIADKLHEGDHEMVDHGAHSYDPMGDYPPVCIACSEAIMVDPGSLGIVIEGSGNGEQIATNKVKGVRAAFVQSLETTRLGREHNGADVVAVGTRQHGHEEALLFVELSIGTPFSGDGRHQRRIDLAAQYESSEH